MSPTQLYDTVDGARLRPEWAGQEVPIPTAEVRSRIRMPAKYALASLAAQVATTYHPGIYAGARNYVSRFPEFAPRGQGLMLGAATGTGVSYAAGAILNEIVARSVMQRDTTCSWLSCFWMLRLIQDARDLNRTDTYLSLRDKMMKDDLVVVDDLLAAQHISGGIPFLHALYGYRYDHNLPTITTVTRENGVAVQKAVQSVFGRAFAAKLKETTEWVEVS